MTVASSKIELVEKDGLYYQKRLARIENGKKAAGECLVPYPTTLEELQEFIDKGVETEVHSMNLYVGAKAIEMQAAIRRRLTAKNMPKADYNRLYNKLTSEQIEDCHKTNNPSVAIRAEIVEMWKKEIV